MVISYTINSSKWQFDVSTTWRQNTVRQLVKQPVAAVLFRGIDLPPIGSDDERAMSIGHVAAFSRTRSVVAALA